jgi:hypothetical protein
MIPESKRLLITDLCARLPYDTIVSVAEGGIDGVQWNKSTLNFYLLHQIEEEDGWEFIKPYLRPMDDMTEEESEEFSNMEIVGYSNYDWLNAHHFDYRGLIEKGLAIDCTGLNIY